MLKRCVRFAGSALACVLLVAGWVTTAAAQDSSINYDNLSFVEEPLAAEVFGFTLTYNHIYDVPVVMDFSTHSERTEVVSVFELNIEKQLATAITIGASYSGVFDDSKDDKYSDAWAAYLGGVWGTTFIGEVTGLVEESTRRFRGVGNADLILDHFIGKTEDLGITYRGRFSAVTATGSVDKNGDYDLGLSYRRPSQYVDHHVTLRHMRGSYEAADGSGTIETRGYGLVGEIVYGSMLIDAGVGFEEFRGSLGSEHRVFVSGGISYKYNMLSVSAEGHYGEIAGGTEFSYSIGGRFDIARGASINVGYNYADIDAPFYEEHGETSKLYLSLRYEY